MIITNRDGAIRSAHNHSTKQKPHNLLSCDRYGHVIGDLDPEEVTIKNLAKADLEEDDCEALRIEIEEWN